MDRSGSGSWISNRSARRVSDSGLIGWDFVRARLQQMRDVFAGEGVEDERILNGPATGLGAIDLGQGEDLADMCARVEAPGQECLVVGR